MDFAGHWHEGIAAEDMTAIVWLRPNIVVEIAFTEWTEDGNLRHARFVANSDSGRGWFDVGPSGTAVYGSRHRSLRAWRVVNR